MVDVVTGGSGFIGSHVVDKLVDAGRKVRVFDKVPPQREGVEWLKGDLLNYDDFLEACADAETVYNPTSGATSSSWNFGYDSMNRLTSAQSAGAVPSGTRHLA